MRPDFLIPIVIVLLFLGGVISTVRLIFIGRTSRRWPTAQGRIVSLLIKAIEGSGSGGLSTYRPTISYCYRVKDRDYEGSRIDVTFDLSLAKAHDSLTQGGAAKVLEGYFPGRPVVVYYNPEHPDYSLLKPGASWGLYLVSGAMILGGIAFVGVWILLVDR